MTAGYVPASTATTAAMFTGKGGRCSQGKQGEGRAYRN
jgi:hypothetical protein